MTDRFAEELIFLCERAGFKTPAEVVAYMQREGINCVELYNELDALCFPKFI